MSMESNARWNLRVLGIVTKHIPNMDSL